VGVVAWGGGGGGLVWGGVDLRGAAWGFSAGLLGGGGVLGGGDPPPNTPYFPLNCVTSNIIRTRFSALLQ